MPRDLRALLPREHGSWAFLLSPQIAASIAAPRPAGALVMTGIAVGLFLAFHLVTPARIKRAPAVESTGILAAGTLGAMAFRRGGGDADGAITLAIASSVYFLLSLIWVRMRMASETDKRKPFLPAGWNTIASLALLIVSGTAGILSGRFIAGMLPGLYLLRSFLPVPRRPSGKIRMTFFGIQEAAAAALFTIGLGLYLPE